MKAPKKVLFLYARMQFIYPKFLYALGFIAIPIIIHLFNLVKPKKVIFSNINFLKEVELKSSRKVKFRHFLILISRILFITALVLLFAQPVITSEANTGNASRNYVSIYLDNSLSMGALNNDEQKLSYAIKEINKIVDQYPTNAKFQLVDNNFNPNSLFYFRKEKIKDMLTEVELSTKVKTAKEIYQRQQALKNKENIEELDLIWISDFQKSVFNDIEQIQKDTTNTHYLFNLGTTKQSNIYIDSLYLMSPFVKKDVKTDLVMVLKNDGEQDVENANVKITVGNREIANNSLAIKAGAKEEMNMNFILDQVGEVNAAIIISNDDVDFDNSFLLSIQVESELNILTITDSSVSKLSNVFKSEAMFNETVVKSNSIDYGKLNSFDVIFLDHLETIRPALADALARQQDKTAIVIIPKRTINTEAYQTLFGKLACSVVMNEATTSSQLMTPDFKNPFFKGVFEKEDAKMNMPKVTSKFDLRKTDQVILRTQAGKPSLAAYTQKGKVYVFNSPLYEPESDFIVHSLIVPVMYKIAMNSTSKNRTLYTTVNGSFQDISIPDSVESVFQLQNEDYKLIPDQKIKNRKLTLNLNANEVKTGFYKLMAGNTFVKTIAVNMDKSESLFEAVEIEKIQHLNDNKESAIDESSIAAQFEKLSVGIPLWRYCLYLALVFLLVEIVLIRFYKA